jgi:hypothetical protein
MTMQQGSEPPAEAVAEHIVLIVEDDVDRRTAQLAALAACTGASCLGVSSADCSAVALAVSPRALLLLLSEDGAIGSEVQQLLEADHRLSAVIVGHEAARRARRRYPSIAARLYGVAAPARAEEIDAFVAAPPLVESWAGSFSPAECLRAAGVGGHSLSIECVAANGARLGAIGMEHGAIVSASTASRSGLEALRELVTTPGARTIMRPPVQVAHQPELAGDWAELLRRALQPPSVEAAGPCPRFEADAREGDGERGSTPVAKA